MNTKKEENKEKHSTISAVIAVTGAVGLTVVGIVVIPPFLRKYSNKLYKFSTKNSEIDFDNLGPEIVRKEEMEDNNGND